jgi:hypothetical protein
VEITADDLKDHYESTSTAELRELPREELTPEASAVLAEVLDARPDEPSAAPAAGRAAFRPSWPRLWPGYAGAGLLFLLEVIAAMVRSNGLEVAFLLVGLGCFLYWLAVVRDLHKILAAATGGTYPISPRNVTLYHFIPFYNLYWICHWPSEVARFVNARSPQPVIPIYFPAFVILAALVARITFDGALGTVLLFAILGYLVGKVRAVLSVLESIEELGP